MSSLSCRTVCGYFENSKGKELWAQIEMNSTQALVHGRGPIKNSWRRKILNESAEKIKC